MTLSPRIFVVAVSPLTPLPPYRHARERGEGLTAVGRPIELDAPVVLTRVGGSFRRDLAGVKAGPVSPSTGRRRQPGADQLLGGKSFRHSGGDRAPIRLRLGFKLGRRGQLRLGFRFGSAGGAFGDGQAGKRLGFLLGVDPVMTRPTRCVVASPGLPVATAGRGALPSLDCGTLASRGRTSRASTGFERGADREAASGFFRDR
jgi:hypothetical protein